MTKSIWVLRKDDFRISLRSGFTLIELLVVVLIIGILAAVALPQYEKVVAKSRAAEAVVLMSRMVQAEQVFFLANGRYTLDLTELDIEIPISKNFNYVAVNSGVDGVSPTSYYRGTANSTKYGLYFEYPFANSSSRWCVANETNETANAICAGYGTYDHSGFGSKYYKMY